MAEAVILERHPPAVPASAGDGFSVEIEPFLGLGRVQLWDAADETKLAAHLGIALPLARSSSSSEGITIAWMAPGEWLLLGAEAEVAERLAGTEATSDMLVMATDLTYARAAFRLSGPRARERLASLCPVDVSHAAFPASGVIRSLLGDAGVFILRLPDDGGAPAFRVVVDQAMAAYAARMLAEPKRMA